MYLILIIAGTVALDQLVKHMVAGSMMLGQTIPVINNFFHITYIHNDGAAFGIMAGKAIFLIGLPALMMATGIVVLALFRKKLDPLVLIAIALRLRNQNFHKVACFNLSFFFCAYLSVYADAALLYELLKRAS